MPKRLLYIDTDTGKQVAGPTIFDFASDPTVDDDITLDYQVDDRWRNTTATEEKEYVCVDNTDGAAIWLQTTFASTGDTIIIEQDITFVSALFFNNQVTPPTITGNEDDYSPTGIKEANVLRLTSTGTRSITGIQAPTVNTETLLRDGQVLYIVNVGTSGTISLKDNDSGSLAVNRFLIGGVKNLQAGEGVIVIYDQQSERWRAAAINI